jgi:hypothetical protein
MKLFLWIPIVFADRGETLRELGGGFRGERAKVSPYEVAAVVLAGLGVIAFFWLLARYAVWREGHRVYHNPKQLFRKLARAHGLSLRQRWLMGQAARHVNVPLPACLFLRPDLFDIAAANSRLSGRADELKALKRKLFAQI